MPARRAAAALDGGLRRPLRLFVNVEPDALGMAMPAHAEPIVARAREELDLVVELTERSLADRPADVLAIVARCTRRASRSRSTTSAPTRARWR